MIKISKEHGIAKASGKPYQYISISYDGMELTRLFLKPTEIQFYENLLGSYTLTDE